MCNFHDRPHNETGSDHFDCGLSPLDHVLWCEQGRGCSRLTLFLFRWLPGELALLFAAPRNATIVLKKDEEEERSSDDDSDDSDDSDDQERPLALVKNVLWRIHREKFIAVMHNDESDQGKYTFFVGLKPHSFFFSKKYPLFS